MFYRVQLYLWHVQIPRILLFPRCFLPHRYRYPCHLCSPSPPAVHFDRSFGRSELQNRQKKSKENKNREKTLTERKYFFKVISLFFSFKPGMMLLLKVHVILGCGMPLAPQASKSRSPLLSAMSPSSSTKTGWVWTESFTVQLSCPTALVAKQV